MMNRPRADRCLEVARELRAAAEETRRTLQASRDLVRRSREQATTGPSASGDDPGPSKHLVTSLIAAYEAADDDPDPQTRLLLGHVLYHVGRRVAGVMGLRAAGIALH